jgi:fructose/tagatose bisphosphate aldolase
MQRKGFALPAVNVTGSNTINGVLETAAKLNAPVISSNFLMEERSLMLAKDFLM